MPIYDYQCTKCGNNQEVLTLRVSEEPVLKCEQCGSDEMEKCVPNKMNFKLIGEGWYEDGYNYTYTKTKAGTDDKVKPVYSKKKAKEALQKYKDNAMDGFKHEKI